MPPGGESTERPEAGKGMGKFESWEHKVEEESVPFVNCLNMFEHVS